MDRVDDSQTPLNDDADAVQIATTEGRFAGRHSAGCVYGPAPHNLDRVVVCGCSTVRNTRAWAIPTVLRRGVNDRNVVQDLRHACGKQKHYSRKWLVYNDSRITIDQDVNSRSVSQKDLANRYFTTISMGTNKSMHTVISMMFTFVTTVYELPYNTRQWMKDEFLRIASLKLANGANEIMGLNRLCVGKMLNNLDMKDALKCLFSHRRKSIKASCPNQWMGTAMLLRYLVHNLMTGTLQQRLKALIQRQLSKKSLMYSNQLWEYRTAELEQVLKDRTEQYSRLFGVSGLF